MLPEHLSNSPLWVIISDKKARVVPNFLPKTPRMVYEIFEHLGDP